MPRAAKDNEPRLWDRILEDPLFEELLEEREATKAAVKAGLKIAARLKARIAELDLKPEERVRVGDFIITGLKRNGGGFSIPAWESVVGTVEKI